MTETTPTEDDPTAGTLLLLENEIAMGRLWGMAGQTLGAMCSARDEIERLHARLAAADAACISYYDWEYGDGDPNASLLVKWKEIKDAAN